MPIIEYSQNSSDVNNILKFYARKVTSQDGEDGIIEKIFETIGDENYSQWCVEFGAWDGKHLSNTYNLIVNQGWNSVLIEGEQDKFQELATTYANYPNVYTFNSMIGFSDEDNLESILSQTPIPKDFGLISIDIDGCDYYIWESLTTYRPAVVVIEYNPTVPNDIIFIQDKDMSLNQGSSLLALIDLGKEKGYELVAVTRTNGIFVLADHYIKFNISDNNIHKMKEDPGTRIWQGYDSTIFTNNCSRLRWKGEKGYEIDPEELQVLPKSMRFYRNRIVEVNYQRGHF